MHPHRIKIGGAMTAPYAGTRKGGVYAGKLMAGVRRPEMLINKQAGTIKGKHKGGWIMPALTAASLIPSAIGLVKGLFKKKEGSGRKIGSKGIGELSMTAMDKMARKGGKRMGKGTKKAGALVTPGPLA